MQKRLILVAAALGLVVPAAGLGGCGSTIVRETEGQGGGGGEGGGLPNSSATGPIWDAGKDAFDEYVDPGCPSTPPPIEDFQCDPFDQLNSGCFPGEGCFIFVSYPDEPCGQEVYGAFCAPAGTGVQGDPCGSGSGLWCAAGFACVVTGSGTQCVKLCPLDGNDDCPSGLVCEPIDVEGFGGCL
ncbi:hypothetical protein [Polyangium spumosum]|uniref:Uncharacterized protein n=1 Tax=Polyangium spumosum TaxID=889282 RepID=A0A6N7Q2U6_9BACT|nr:hypothetical protein [Polyangium spumosum]MRG98359.1 hypothetical protein [Polyangium spumosum]